MLTREQELERQLNVYFTENDALRVEVLELKCTIMQLQQDRDFSFIRERDLTAQLAAMTQTVNRVYKLELSIRDTCGPELNCLSNMGIGFVEKAVKWYQARVTALSQTIEEYKGKLFSMSCSAHGSDSTKSFYCSTCGKPMALTPAAAKEE